jgi:sterol desaturase/sphingolipid hydroxylase (fatty acid hydroxylase superfamily)
MVGALSAFWLGLGEELGELVGSGGKRSFWGFLASSLLVAAAVLWARGARSPRALWAALFPRHIYLHPSARLDVQILAANAVLRTLTAGLAIASPVALAALVSKLLVEHTGWWPQLAWPMWLVGGAYTFVHFLVDDATRYLLHRAMHERPLLWALHQVHHSAEVLTPLTIYRIHPLERVLIGLRGVLGSGLVAGVFVFLFRGRLTFYEIAGVNAVGFWFNLLGANLRHSHVWLSFGPLEWLWLSPAQHQLHHSRAPRHHGKNYGSFLAIWDVLGRTHLAARGEKPPELGLTPEDQNHAPTLRSALLSPVAALFGRKRAG